jgi:oxygen-independent coproporphyrinogen-3 oxidase
VPFCERRCHYCSFNTAPQPDRPGVERYLAAAHRELALLGGVPWARAVTVVTVFLGGGTPSLLETDDVGALVDDLRTRFTLAGDAEITIECNPESVSRTKLEGYRAAGVSRISLGVQSLDDRLLARLGRLHDARRAHAAFDAAHQAGFDNVSVDLMYGLPGLDLPTWRHTLETVLAWMPDHLSAYGLTLDPGSAWASSGVPGLPVEDAVVEQYWALTRAAAAHGLEHYEISNYARPRFRSRHNQIYWRAQEYLACGPGACGFVGDLRYGNVRATARYCARLEEGVLPVEDGERLDARQRLAERLILGLRTADGVPAVWLRRRAEGDGALSRRLGAWREQALLVEHDDHVRLTEAGFLLSDALFVELL